MEQFYGAMIWYHLMVPFYGMCVPGITFPANFLCLIAMCQFIIRGKRCYVVQFVLMKTHKCVLQL